MQGQGPGAAPEATVVEVRTGAPGATTTTPSASTQPAGGHADPIREPARSEPSCETPVVPVVPVVTAGPAWAVDMVAADGPPGPERTRDTP